MKVSCPHCHTEFDLTATQAAAALGSTTSKAKARSSRRNAKLGGWPKGRLRKANVGTESAVG